MHRVTLTMCPFACAQWCAARKKPDDGRVLSRLIPTYKFIVTLSWIIWAISVALLAISLNESPRSTECKAGTVVVDEGGFSRAKVMVQVTNPAVSPICQEYVTNEALEDSCWNSIQEIDQEPQRTCSCWYLVRRGQCIVFLSRPKSAILFILSAIVVTFLGILCLYTTVVAVRSFASLRAAEETILLSCQSELSNQPERETVSFSVEGDTDDDSDEELGGKGALRVRDTP